MADKLAPKGHSPRRGAGGATPCRTDSPRSFWRHPTDIPAMSPTAPHYLLHTQAASFRSDNPPSGHWRFVLSTPDGTPAIQAEDEEQAASAERLELLAVIRGLEAIDSPSRVVLLNASPRLRRALEQDLARWRDDDWHWERFGRLVPIKNADLWQRLDRLRSIHVLQCGPATLEAADDLRPPPAVASTHLAVGGRRLRIDRPGGHAADRNVSIDSENTYETRATRRGAAGRQAARRRRGEVASGGAPRQGCERGPPWKRSLGGVLTALGGWWQRWCGRQAALTS
jgi:ribonuclease HI